MNPKTAGQFHRSKRRKRRSSPLDWSRLIGGIYPAGDLSGRLLDIGTLSVFVPFVSFCAIQLVFLE